MTELDALSYEIEQLYIDGFSPSRIAKILDCPIGLVFDWLEENNMGVAKEPQEEPYNSYFGA